MKSPRLIYETGRGVGAYRFSHERGGEGIWLPVPRLFWLSVLVALDSTVSIPSHSGEIQTEGQDGNSTRGKTDAHEGRSNQTSRNGHGIKSHLVSHHRRNPFQFVFPFDNIHHTRASTQFIYTNNDTTNQTQHPADTTPPSAIPGQASNQRPRRPPSADDDSPHTRTTGEPQPRTRAKRRDKQARTTRHPPRPRLSKNGERRQTGTRRDTSRGDGDDERKRGRRRTITRRASKHGARAKRVRKTGRRRREPQRTRQASKERPARLVEGTGRKAIRNHTRTRGGEEQTQEGQRGRERSTWGGDGR